MPQVNPTRKLVAKTFRKNVMNDLREDKGRVKVMDADITRRLKDIRKMHKTMLGIKPKNARI